MKTVNERSSSALNRYSRSAEGVHVWIPAEGGTNNTEPTQIMIEKKLARGAPNTTKARHASKGP
jgi:hypothetical protein